MILVNVQNRSATATALSPVTSGSEGIPVRFRFTSDWADLDKTAVFRGSGQEIEVALTDDACICPAEAVAEPYEMLEIGVYGESEEITTRTNYAVVGRIEPGAG